MRALFLLFLISWGVAAQAQSVILSYHDVHVGRNVNLIYRSAGPHHQFYGGFKYHVNRLIHDSEPRRFKKRIYATDFVQRMGLRLGYQYQFPLTSHSRLSVFYDHQLTRSGTRNRIPVSIGVADTTEFFNIERADFEVLNTWEQIVGLGLEAHLSPGLFMAFQAGIGSAFFWSIPDATTSGDPYDGPSRVWQVAHMFSLGLGYRFE